MANQDEVDRMRRDRIQERAYQIYRARGGYDGLDEQDWLQAEREVDGLPPDDDQLAVPEEEEQASP
jgi:hypothetical protein